MSSKVVDDIQVTVPCRQTSAIASAMNSMCSEIADGVEMAMLSRPISAIVTAVNAVRPEHADHVQIASCSCHVGVECCALPRSKLVRPEP